MYVQVCTPLEWYLFNWKVTEIKEKEVHVIEAQSCLRKLDTRPMASGGSACLVSGCWQLIYLVLWVAKWYLGTDFVPEYENKLVWRSTHWALHMRPLLMQDFTLEEGLGVLSGSDHFRMNPRFKVSWSRAIYVELMWLLCISFNAVADWVWPA